MRLFLVRHAEATRGEPDDLRPLTPAGREAARALGTQLAPHAPDSVLTSPLLRARETGELIGRACGVGVQADERLAPGATADTLREATAGKGDVVVAVGHQPDCSEIVLELTGCEVSFAPADVQVLEL